MFEPDNAFSDLDLHSNQDDSTTRTPAASFPSRQGIPIHTENESIASAARSEVTLTPESPFRQQLLEHVNRNEGTLTSLQYQSRHGSKSQTSLISIRRNRRSRSIKSRRSKSLSRRATKSLSQRSGKSKSIRSNLGRKEESFNEEKFKLLEQRIVNNTRGRKLVEETDLLIDGERIKRKIIQPRKNEHGDYLQTTSKNACVLISKGELFDNPVESKPCQDSVAVSTWKDFECFVVCDGHGKSGEEAAWQVSNFISGEVMKSIIDHYKTNRRPGLTDAEVFERATARRTIEKIFKECDEKVVWTKELRNFTWAKIIGGEFEGLMCQISSPNLPMREVVKVSAMHVENDMEGEEDIPVSIFKNGVRQFKPKAARFQIFGSAWIPPDRQLELDIEARSIKRKFLLCERDFFGGTTCVLLIRHKGTNLFRFATSGDSRILYVPNEGQKPNYPEDETTIKISPKPFGLRKEVFGCYPCGDKRRPVYRGKCLLSVEHNVHDPREMQRLQRDFAGCYVVGDGITNEGVEGYLYSNALFPYTGGITPTRGFGDRLYFGSGYTYEPEISEVHTFLPGSILVGGSDGVFDDSVWGKNMQGLAYVVKMMQERKMRTEDIIAEIHRQTVRRCKEWNHFRVDDISLFGFQNPPTMERSL